MKVRIICIYIGNEPSPHLQCHSWLGNQGLLTTDNELISTLLVLRCEDHYCSSPSPSAQSSTQITYCKHPYPISETQISIPMRGTIFPLHTPTKESKYQKLYLLITVLRALPRLPKPIHSVQTLLLRLLFNAISLRTPIALWAIAVKTLAKSTVWASNVLTAFGTAFFGVDNAGWCCDGGLWA